MAKFEIGEEVQFTRKVTETNPDRVINVDEKGRIIAVAADGSYTVELQAGDPPFSGITDDDLEAGLDDEAPVAKKPPSPPPAPAASDSTDPDPDAMGDDSAGEDDEAPSP